MIPFYKSKTFWFAVLTIVTAVAAIFGFQDYKPSADVQDILLLVVGVVNLILRFLPTKNIKSPLTER